MENAEGVDVDGEVVGMRKLLYIGFEANMRRGYAAGTCEHREAVVLGSRCRLVGGADSHHAEAANGGVAKQCGTIGYGLIQAHGMRHD